MKKPIKINWKIFLKSIKHQKNKEIDTKIDYKKINRLNYKNIYDY